MSSLPTDHPKNLVDFRTFHRTGKFRVSDGCLGNKVYQQLGGRVDMQHSDVWGSVQTWVVTWLFSILQRNFPWDFLLEAVSFFFFFLLGCDSMERCGVFFATVGESMGFCWHSQLTWCPFGAAPGWWGPWQFGCFWSGDATSWPGTRHGRPAGFFRPDVGIAFLRWNETRLQFSNFKSMFEGQFLHQLGCIVNSGINYQAELVSLHPGKLTWNPKMKVWKMILLFNCVFFLL